MDPIDDNVADEKPDCEIDRLQRTEASLRKSEARLNFALQTLSAGTWDLDLVDHSAHRSLLHDQIFGYKTLLPAWTYEMFLEHVLPEDRSEVDRLFRAAADTHSNWNFECRIRRADGEVRWILAAGTHEQSPEGIPTRMRGIVQDITERKTIDARIDRITHLYAALSQCNQAIAHSGKLEDLLPAICRDVVEFGRMRMAWIGMVDAATGEVHPMACFGSGTKYLDRIQISANADSPWGQGPTGKAIREGKSLWCQDFQNDPSTIPWRERAAIHGWAAAASLPLHREGMTVGALTIYGDKAGIFDEEARKLLEEMADDISFALDAFAREDDRKQKEAMLRAMNSELERFTYTVSHDLKSPLVTIKTFLDYLEEDLQSKDEESQAKDFAYIRRAADKMGTLLNELLQLARIGHKKNSPVEAPLQEIVQEALNLVAGQLAERKVQVEITREPIWLTGDRSRLVEIFQNLLDNSVKFLGEQPSPQIEIGWESENEEIFLFVRDNGMGIDPRHQSKLFGLFEKLDPQTPGTGMGLAMVKRIVEMHGGKIQVHSDGLGRGATFRFTLANTHLK